MHRSFILAVVCSSILTLGLFGVHRSEADTETETKPKPSLLSYLEPGQRVMHTRYEGGLVRLEVVEKGTLRALKKAESEGKDLGDIPTVDRVMEDYVVLRWNTEDRTATQVLPKSTILEIWVNNELK